MHGDEGDVEAADEEARDQKPVGPVASGVVENAAQRQGVGDRRRRLRTRRRRFEEPRHRQNEQKARAQEPECVEPTETGDEGLPHRHDEELAERAGGGGHAERPGPPFRGQQAREGREHDGERGERLPQADHQPGGEHEPERGRRHRRRRHADGVDDEPARQHPRRADTIGKGAGEGLEHTPQQVLNGEGEGEIRARPAVKRGHGLEEEPHRRTGAEGGDHDHATRGDDHGRCARPGHAAARRPAGRFDQWVGRGLGVYWSPSRPWKKFSICGCCTGAPVSSGRRFCSETYAT